MIKILGFAVTFGIHNNNTSTYTFVVDLRYGANPALWCQHQVECGQWEQINLQPEWDFTITFTRCFLLPHHPITPIKFVKQLFMSNRGITVPCSLDSSPNTGSSISYIILFISVLFYFILILIILWKCCIYSMLFILLF